MKRIEVNSGSCGGGQKLRIFGESKLMEHIAPDR